MICMFLTLCRTVEDEKHFLLSCKINEALRKKIFQTLQDENHHFNDSSEDQKLISLLNPSTPQQVKIIGSFLKQSLKLRSGD